MPSRKPADAAMADGSNCEATSLLQRIRNMWEFANLCQWIYIFGKAAKIDDALEIEEIETECLRPNSTVLSEIGLGLLKLLSAHRGLTNETFDEQLRKQYIARLPLSNPMGNGETATHTFASLEAPTKIVVLQQLTQWIMSQPERLRGKMEESKDIDQTTWRIEPYGWDAHDLTYYVLDDNRVYRLTEANPPATNPKKYRAHGSSRRASKRRRTRGNSLPENIAEAESNDSAVSPTKSYLGSKIWECIAVTLDDVRGLVDSFRKTRDANEKILRDRLALHLLPILEKQDEARKRKEAQRQRELVNLAKMANAKRSSRIADKMEQQREDAKAQEERQNMQKELEAQRRAEIKRVEMERERDFRMFSRERRLKERAARRQLHEEELSQLSGGRHSTPEGPTRISNRRLQSEIDRNRQALKKLEEEEEEWTFDCVCGLFGQVDDGAHSIACERCNVWQHSKCAGIKESEADRGDFQFVCGSCQRRAEGASTPRKTIIKLKVKSYSDAATVSSSTPREHIMPSIVAAEGSGLEEPIQSGYVSSNAVTLGRALPINHHERPTDEPPPDTNEGTQPTLMHTGPLAMAADTSPPDSSRTSPDKGISEPLNVTKVTETS